MLLLACSRRLKVLDRLLSDKGEWSYVFGYIGGIQGETLGLIGFGKIAKTLARKAKCFGMNIITYDPYVCAEIFKETGVTSVSLEELLKKSDYISLHAPLTDETEHLIGEKELELMKKTAVIINTARGKLIDEEALINTLRKKRISGVGLDVFEKEPPEPGNALLHMDNVIVTPHCASYSIESYNKLRTAVIDEVVRVFRGKLPKNLYNSFHRSGVAKKMEF